jgi:hypothetical protein
MKKDRVASRRWFASTCEFTTRIDPVNFQAAELSYSAPAKRLFHQTQLARCPLPMITMETRSLGMHSGEDSEKEASTQAAR